jgi:hypothetical protein
VIPKETPSGCFTGFFPFKIKKIYNMQQQQQIMADINKLIASSSDQLLCNPECQKNRKIEQLKEQIQKAKANIDTAPHQLQQAKNNYYQFVLGELDSNKQLEAEFKQQAQAITKKIMDTYNRHTDDVILMATDLDNSTNILTEITDFYNNLSQQNKENIFINNKNTQRFLTNNRKSYYELQKIDSLKYWHIFLSILFLIIFIFYFYFTKHSIFIIAIVFFIPFILHFIISFFL